MSAANEKNKVAALDERRHFEKKFIGVKWSHDRYPLDMEYSHCVFFGISLHVYLTIRQRGRVV